MSNPIDTRVVEMQFDNKQFEAGVRQTLYSLKDLKDSLADVGHEEVNRNLKVISDGIEALQKRFSWFGETVHKIQMNLVGAVKNMATDIIGFKEMNAGMNKYEGLMNATRVLMNATGKSAEELEAVFDKLYAYTDMTSYGFTELSDSMAQLVMSGKLKSVEDAEKVVEGFANACAHAGVSTSEAREPLYLFNKAMQLGYFGLDQWNSPNMKKIVTPQFRKSIIETAKALGVLDEKGRITSGKGKGKVVTEGNIEKMLSYKWLTSDVMAGVMKLYSDIDEYDDNGNLIHQGTELANTAYKAAMEAKTFTDVLGALKDAVSTGWSTSFKLLFGNVDQAATFFTWMADKLISASAVITDFRNNLLKGWNEAGGRDTLIDTVVYLWETLERIGDIFSQAFSNVFGEINVDDLVNFTNTIHQAVQDFYFWLGGDADPGAKIAPRFVLLRQAIEGVASVIQFLGDVAAGVFNFLFGMYGEKVGTVDEVLLKIGEWGRGIKDFFDQIKKNEGVQKFFSNLLTILKPFASILIPTITYLLIGKKVLNGQNVGLIKMVVLITTLYNTLMNIPVVSGLLKDLWGFITGIVSDITNMKDPEEFAANLAKRWDDFKKRFGVTFEGLKKYLSDWFANTWAKIKDWFVTVLPKIYSDVKTAVINWLASTWTTISNWFTTELPKAFETGKNAVIKFFTDLWAKITALFSGGGAETAEALADAAGSAEGSSNGAGPFEVIKQWLFSAWETIVKAWNWLKEKIGPYFEKIGTWLADKWEALKQFFSVQFSEAESTNINWKGLVNRLMAMAPVLIALFLVYKIVQSMSEIKAGKLIAVAITMFGISLAVNLLVDSFGNLLGGLDGLSGIINSILTFIKENQMTIAIVMFGAAIIAVAGAVSSMFLAVRKWGVVAKRFSHLEFKSDMIRVGDVLGQGAGAITQTVNMIGITIAGLGAAIYMLTLSIKNMADMLPDFFTAEEKLSEEAKIYKQKFLIAVGVIAGIMLLTITAGIILNKKNKNTSSKSSPMEALAKIVIGITILAAELVGLVYILKLIDWATIGDGLLKLGALIGGIGLIVAIADMLAAVGRALNKGHSIFDDMAKTMALLIQGVFKFALSVGLLVLAVLSIYLLIKNANQNDLMKMGLALGAIVGLLFSLVLAVRLLPKFSKDDKLKGFIPLILSLVVLVGILKNLMLMNAVFGVGNVLIALGEVVGFLIVLAAAVSAIGHFSKESEAAAVLFGVIAFIVTIGFLLEATANMELKRVMVVFGSLSAVLVAVGYLTKQLRTSSKDAEKTGVSVGGMAVLFAGMIIVIAEMGALLYFTKDVPWQNMASLGLMTVLISVSMAVMAKAAEMYNKVDWASIGKLAVSLIVFAGLMFVSAMALRILEPVKASWEDLAKLGAVIVGGLIVLLAASLVLMAVGAIGKGINIAGVAKVGVAIIILAAMIGVALVVLSLLLKITGSLTESAMQDFSNGLFAIGSTLGTFQSLTKDLSAEKFKAVIGIITDLTTCMIGLIGKDYSGVRAFSDQVFMLGVALYMFDYSTSNINRDTIKSRLGIIDDIKTTVESINNIGEIKDLTSVITDLGGAINLYYSNLSKVNLHPLDDQGNEITGADIDTKGIAQMFHDIAADFGDVKSDIESAGVFAVNGEGTALGNFAVGITNLKTAIGDYVGMASEIKPDDLTASNELLDKFKEIQQYLPKEEEVTGIFGIWSSTTTQQTLGQFALDIGAVGVSLAAYANSVSGAVKVLDEKTGETNFDVAAKALTGLGEIQKALPERVQGFISQFGQMTLGEFASNIAQLGDGLAQYVDKIDGKNFDNTKLSMTPLNSLANVYNKISKNGNADLWGNLLSANSFTNFSGNLESLGKGLAGYADAVSGKDFEGIDSSIAPLNALADFYIKLGSNPNDFWGNLFGTSSLDNFTGNLTKLGTGVNSFITNAFANGVVYDADKIKTVTDMLSNLASASISKEGSWAIWDLTNQLVDNTNMADDIKKFVEKINTIKDSDLESAVNKMIEIGKLLDEAIGEGMDTSNDTYSVKGAIENTIGLIENEVKKATAKPSGGIYLSGKYIDEGLAAGIYDYAHKPSQAMGNVMSRVISQGNRVAKIKSPSKVFSEMGMWIDLGLEHGIIDYTKAPVSAAEFMAYSIEEAVRDITTVHSDPPLYNDIGSWIPEGLRNGIESAFPGLLSTVESKLGELQTVVSDGWNNILSVFNGDMSVEDALLNTFKVDKDTVSKVMEAFKNKDYASVISQLTGLGIGEVDIAKLFGIDTGSFLEGTSLEDMFKNLFGFEHTTLETDSKTTKVDTLNMDDSTSSGLGRGSSRANNDASNLGKQTTTVSSGGLNLSMTEGYTIGDILNRIDRLETAITNMRIVMDTGVLAGQVASGVDKELGNYATLNGRWN